MTSRASLVNDGIHVAVEDPERTTPKAPYSKFCWPYVTWKQILRLQGSERDKAGLGNHKRDYLTSLSSIDRRAILPINIALHSYAKCKNSTHLVSYLINELRGASSSLSIVCKFPIPSGSSLSSTAH